MKVSNLELASYFGISRQAIAMLVARGVIIKCDDGLFDLKQATLAYCSQLRDAAAGRAHEVSEVKMNSLRAGASLKEVQCELAQARLARETKATVDRAEIIEALERLMMNTRNHILTLPLKIKTTLRLDIDAQDTITQLVHDVLTNLSERAVTIHEAVAYKEKPFSELTIDEILAMSYSMMMNQTFLSDEDKKRLIDEIVRDAERSAILATPSRPDAGRAP
jgi:phage terminase Nu1 subunit (DNA packaging protein)